MPDYTLYASDIKSKYFFSKLLTNYKLNSIILDSRKFFI